MSEDQLKDFLSGLGPGCQIVIKQDGALRQGLIASILPRTSSIAIRLMWIATAEKGEYSAPIINSALSIDTRKSELVNIVSGRATLRSDEIEYQFLPANDASCIDPSMVEGLSMSREALRAFAFEAAGDKLCQACHGEGRGTPSPELPLMECVQCDGSGVINPTEDESRLGICLLALLERVN